MICHVTAFQSISLPILIASLSELVITSGGKNIAPISIENALKEKVPFLSNVMVVGDHRNFITCLVTLKVRYYKCHNRGLNLLFDAEIKACALLSYFLFCSV